MSLPGPAAGPTGTRGGLPLPAPGHTGVDYEERVDFARLRDYRVSRAKSTRSS